MPPTPEPASVIAYAGYKGEETPRAVIVAGRRFEVVSILSRERILDPLSGERREVWRCRLDDGRTAIIELHGDGVWRASV